MVDKDRVRGAGRRGRAVSSVLYSSVILAAVVSGCSGPGRLRWCPISEDPRGPQPGQSTLDQALTDKPAGDSRVTRTAAETPGGTPAGNPAPSVPPAQEYPIDLSTALRLAEVENPLIAEARQRVGEALALQQKARVLLLPNLNAGANFHYHQGDLQRSSGRILRLDEKSLYVGGGAGAMAAGTTEVPAVNIVSQLTDAIFEPLAARQEVDSSRFSARATANRILMEVAEFHFELLAAVASLRVRRETAVQGTEVARLTRAYADAQEGREADAERASTELSLIEREIQMAEEDAAVASARLARRLHLDQSVRVRPVAPVVDMVTIVDPASHLPDLIRTALARRPEIGARAAALASAETRHREEKARPLLPTLVLGFSGGSFGGGSNLTGVELGAFRGRTDFDVQAFWTLRNLGAGNLSLIKQRYAQVGQAVGEQSRTIAEVRSEVGAAFAEILAARQQSDLTVRQLASAERGFGEDVERIRNTVGRPIEVVNSLMLLNQARVAHIRAVTDYNKAQFRLFVSLGSPPPLDRPATEPLPPAPIASPPIPPVANRPGSPNPPALAARNTP